MKDTKLYEDILDAKDETGVSKVVFVGDSRHCILNIAGDNSANLTVKVQGSIGNTPATFSSARDEANRWDYVEIIDLEDGSAIDGDTGIGFTGTDDIRQFEVNINAIDWLSVEVTAYSAGDVSATVRLANNA